ESLGSSCGSNAHEQRPPGPRDHSRSYFVRRGRCLSPWHAPRSEIPRLRASTEISVELRPQIHLSVPCHVSQLPASVFFGRQGSFESRVLGSLSTIYLRQRNVPRCHR